VEAARYGGPLRRGRGVAPAPRARRRAAVARAGGWPPRWWAPRRRRTHLAVLLAGRAIEPLGRSALLLGAAGLACCVALLALATPSHGHGAPTLLGMVLLIEAAALVARRRDATRREVALVLAHAPALPALCLLPDGSPAEHAAALGLAYANFVLRLLPHLREVGAPAGATGRRGWACGA